MMNPFFPRLMIAASLLAMLALGSCHQRQQNTGPRTSSGALQKLKPETAKAAPAAIFAGADGGMHSLREFRGRYVLLNLWATWCAPCVRELPALAHLQTAVGAKHLLVVPVNVGRGTAQATATFLKDNKAAALPVYLDSKSVFLRAFGALGLPLTVLIDPQGNEIARASGAVKWDARESVGYFRSLTR